MATLPASPLPHISNQLDPKLPPITVGNQAWEIVDYLHRNNLDRPDGRVRIDQLLPSNRQDFAGQDVLRARLVSDRYPVRNITSTGAQIQIQPNDKFIIIDNVVATSGVIFITDPALVKGQWYVIKNENGAGRPKFNVGTAASPGYRYDGVPGGGIDVKQGDAVMVVSDGVEYWTV